MQTINRRLEDYVPMVEPFIDWAQIEAMRDRLVRGGKAFFEAAIGGLAGAGIDTRDPAQLLLVLKRLGSARCEELFGAGEPDPEFPHGRRPVLETDLVRQTMEERERLLVELQGRREEEAIRGMKVLVTSTDIHEFAGFLLTSTLAAVGTEVIEFGVNRDPEDIVKAVIETDADAVVITTHNGVARAFGEKLMKRAGRGGCRRGSRLHGRRAERRHPRLRCPDRRQRRPQRQRDRDAGHDRPPRRGAGRAPRRRRRGMNRA